MHPAILPAALVFCLSLAMAVYVASHREKAGLHRLLLATLVGLMVWTLGTLCRFAVTSQVGLEASLRLLFLGVFATPPLWLLLATSYARLPITRRRGFWVSLAVPSLLAYVALLTNRGHGLLIRDESFAALEAGGTAWAGPLFWIFVAWAYGCVLAGAGVYLATAGRMVAGEERVRGVFLALASLIPLAVSPIYMFGLLPVRFDLTPTALGASLLLFSATVFRYRLLQSLPLDRRDVIEQLRDGVVMASPSGVILDLNPAAERILGASAWSLRRRELVEVLEELAAESDWPALHAALAQLGSREPVAHEVRTADDRHVSLSVAQARERPEGGAGQFALLRDRTDERRTERLLRQNQRLQTAGTLASGIAHEVNNPLAFIRSNLSQIQKLGERVRQSGPAGGERLFEELSDLEAIAEETLDGIGRIERIVREVRGLATRGAECEEPFAPVDVNAAIRDAVRLANLNRAGVVRLKLLLAEDLPPVRGRAERLVQALLNLLVNAVHAAECAPHPRISVASERDGDAVLVRVSDNGPGIDYDLQERIFDPFFTTKEPDRGTGLGLSIAFDIVREHGGVLEVRSRPGGGAAFVARLPL